MPNKSLGFYADDDEQTVQIGQGLAHHLQPGDVVLLEGDLGAGKSTLARATIRALLNDPELEVPSPTFLLVLPYENQNISVLHADLYRLKDAAEIEELGIAEGGSEIVFVEWPVRAPQLQTIADFEITITIPSGDEGRLLNINALRDQNRLGPLAITLKDYEVKT